MVAEQAGPLASSRSFCMSAKQRRSQVSMRPLSPKRDRVAAEREQVAAAQKLKEDKKRKLMRRKNSLRAMLKSADGLYPRRFV